VPKSDAKPRTKRELTTAGGKYIFSVRRDNFAEGAASALDLFGVFPKKRHALSDAKALARDRYLLAKDFRDAAVEFENRYVVIGAKTPKKIIGNRGKAAAAAFGSRDKVSMATKAASKHALRQRAAKPRGR
jgi:hypothetical protein